MPSYTGHTSAAYFNNTKIRMTREPFSKSVIYPFIRSNCYKILSENKMEGIEINGKIDLGIRRLVVAHVENAITFYAYLVGS